MEGVLNRATGGMPIRTADDRVGGSLICPASLSPNAALLVCIHGSGCHSRYFDLASNSLVAEAIRRGFAVLLIDRPGHGTSTAPKGASTIDLGVAAVASLIATLREAHPDMIGRSIALIGHSFGGAVALAYAALAETNSPAAVCVSGIGDRPDERYAKSAVDDAARAPAAYWLFGPGSSYDWRGITALRAAVAPWREEEVSEITRAWPARWASVAARVVCPIHVRLGEFERIWEVKPQALKRIATAFSNAPRIDIAIAPDGGHLYEVHLRGPELVAAQLDFIAAVTGRVPDVVQA